MSAQVLCLDDFRQRASMRTTVSVVHELPVSIWHDTAAGKRKVEDLGRQRDELLRLIVAEWLAGLGYAEAMGLLEFGE